MALQGDYCMRQSLREGQVLVDQLKTRFWDILYTLKNEEKRSGFSSLKFAFFSLFFWFLVLNHFHFLNFDQET